MHVKPSPSSQSSAGTIISLAYHHSDVIMSVMASQITSVRIVYSTIYSGTDQRKHQSSASLAFVRGIHRWAVNSPHKGPVTRKMFPFDDVIMISAYLTVAGKGRMSRHVPSTSDMKQTNLTTEPGQGGSQRIYFLQLSRFLHTGGSGGSPKPLKLHHAVCSCYKTQNWRINNTHWKLVAI